MTLREDVGRRGKMFICLAPGLFPSVRGLGVSACPDSGSREGRGPPPSTRMRTPSPVPGSSPQVRPEGPSGPLPSTTLLRRGKVRYPKRQETTDEIRGPCLGQGTTGRTQDRDRSRVKWDRGQTRGPNPRPPGTTVPLKDSEISLMLPPNIPPRLSLLPTVPLS